MTESIPEFVDQVLAEPFESPAALEHRIGDVDPDGLRDELVDRIEAGRLEGEGVEIALDILATVGIDDGAYDRLFSLATADDVDSDSRRAAFMALVGSEDFDAMELVNRLGPDKMDDLMAANLSMLMQHAEQVPEVAFELAAQLLEVTGEHRRRLFEMMEQTRERLGLDAGLVYAGIFGDADYQQLWPMLVEAVQEDGVPGDADMLQEAADRATDGDVERQLRQAAMQLRTRGIEEETDHDGIGLFGSCDGTGGFPIVVARERPDGSMDVLNLLFRTTGEFRDAVTFEVPDRDDLDEITSQMQDQAGADFAEVSLPEAAAVVDQRLERARQVEEELPSQFEFASQRVRRLTDDRRQVPEVEPADEVPDEQRCRELFDHWRYDYWYLDRATFVDAELDEPPADDEVAQDWYDEATDRLAGLDHFVDQTATLADHMALWHRFDGDDEAAAEIAAIAERTREEPTDSPLIRVRLEKTLEEWSRQDQAGAEFPVELVEDPDLRRSLRQRFFSEVETPRGSHVVHLTLTCVVFVILDWSLSAVAAKNQPRPDERYGLAYEVAEKILSQLTRAGSPDPEQLHALIASDLARSTFDREDADHVAALILQDTQRYLDEFASSTFYEALGSPQREMGDEFYG